MKRMFKKLARTLWRMSASVRRPIIRKFDQHMIEILGSSAPRIDAPANLELALSSIVRELARLQIQVEILQQQIDDLDSSGRDEARPESRLSVLGEIG